MDILGTVLTAVNLLAQYAPGIMEAAGIDPKYGTILTAAENIKPYAVALYTQLQGSEITPDQQAELEARIDADYARSQVPLPPPIPGDPDYVP